MVNRSMKIPDSYDAAQRQLDAAHLRDENGGDGFVEGRAVHVDGGCIVQRNFQIINSLIERKRRNPHKWLFFALIARMCW